MDADDLFGNADYDDEDDTWEDDPNDPDYLLTLAGDDDLDDEYYDEEDEDDMELDDDEEDEDGDINEVLMGDDDEEEGNVTLVNQDGNPIELDDVDGTTLLNIAAMLNQSGGSLEARTSLLSRLLSGPRSGGRGSLRMASGRAEQPSLTVEERRRMEAQRRKRERWWTPQREPHPNGLELLRSGEFGRVGRWTTDRRKARARAEYRRAMKAGPSKPDPMTLVPNTHGTVVAQYPSIPYVGQYAGEDYGLFYAATQSFTLHLYDTSKSRSKPKKPKDEAIAQARAGASASTARLADDDDDDDPDDGFGWAGWGSRRMGAIREDTSMKSIKQVRGIDGRWTVTDCDVDRRGQRMIYSSITPYVHMLNTGEDDSEQTELDFTSRGRYREDSWGGYDSFGIWSIRFSADGKEVVAGAGNGQILVYDIDAGRRSLSVPAHGDDVNAVCFADESSTNILVSGSDDGYVKVWDRRSLSSKTPSGVLVGATEGITYTSPKGDGRYIVVNSKDQAARLYDLRKMRSHGEFESEPDAVSKYGQPNYDYRDSRYPRPTRIAHPKDCSVMTYRGHSVLRTLIRCHFSPRESTGQSYIYSGSADGMIHIWSLDGRVVQVLNRANSTPLRNSAGGYNDPSAPEHDRSGVRYGAMPYERGLSWAVRDVSWHGYEPTLMSTCWEVDGGYRRGGTVAKHEWKGLGKGGIRNLEDWVEKAMAECEG